MQRWESEPLREVVPLKVSKGDDGKGGEERWAREDGPVAYGIPDLDKPSDITHQRREQDAGSRLTCLPAVCRN